MCMDGSRFGEAPFVLVSWGTILTTEWFWGSKKVVGYLPIWDIRSEITGKENE